MDSLATAASAMTSQPSLRLALSIGRESGGDRRGAHLQMRANSVEGILMVAAYSVSGMPSLQ